MPKFIASIDQGTSSTRCIFFDQAGKIVAADQREHSQFYPKPGWVEHDALEIWARTQEVMENALRKSGLQPTDIAAIGVTNQRETTVLWDRHTGIPVAPAIVWQDTRTESICAELMTQGGQQRFAAKTGLPIATYFSGPKIKWLLESRPDIRRAAESGDVIFGNMDTWIIWNLTGGARGGVHVTDVSNASRTMLMDLVTLKWAPDILEELGIPRGMLPHIKPSSEIYGYANEPFTGVPISGDLGDQQAALFGQACTLPGEAKNTYGTGCFMLMNTGIKPVPSKNGLLTTVGYKLGKEPAIYCLEGSIAIAGALVQWLRDNLKMIESSKDIEPLAQMVKDNGGVFFVPAFSGLYAPYWRSDARGVIVGLTRFVERGHLARAVLEATAFQTLEVLEAMEKDSGVKLTALKVDGGMVGNELLMQFQSDILNVPVIRPIVAETTALGAAYAAGLAVGYWNGVDDIRQNWGQDKAWQPSMAEDVRAQLYHQWKKAVTRTFDWIEV